MKKKTHNMFKATINLLAMLLFLVGCAPQLPHLKFHTSGMGNSIRHVQKMQVFTLHIHFVNSVNLRRAYDFMGGKPLLSGYANRGVTLVDYQSARCDIYVQPPLHPLGQGMLTLGHELTHCLYGDFHNQRPHDWSRLTSARVAEARECFELIMYGKPLPPKCRKKH